MKIPGWMNNNRAVVITAMVCVTLIVIVALLRPPRYQKAGINNTSVLDTRTGKLYFRGIK